MNNQGTIFSLFELATFIQAEINNAFYSPLWVKAELVNINYYANSGHCFPDLVEKENGKIKAQIRATIWNHNYQSIASKFRKITGRLLIPGMQLLFQVQVSYNPLYGLSLNIIDIDPAFTLGALAIEKQLNIDKLVKENIINLNKTKHIPLLLQNLAIISVESSKGFNDFISTLQAYKYKIRYKLFKAVLQGDVAVQTQLDALQEIRKNYNAFDAVFIIRGGGGEIGMNCYDNYELAHCIATFPIPVITGIGHSTDRSIVDMVAYSDMKTPTEAANLVLSTFYNFEDTVNKYSKNISQIVSKNMLQHVHKIIMIQKNIINNTKTNIIKTKSQLSMLIKSIKSNNNTIINNNFQQIMLYKYRQKLLDPVNILKRGFSITYYNGKNIKNTCEVPENEIIETVLYNGKIISKKIK